MIVIIIIDDVTFSELKTTNGYAIISFNVFEISVVMILFTPKHIENGWDTVLLCIKKSSWNLFADDRSCFPLD